MHLAYLDESDTKSKKHKWQVMSGVLVEDINFKLAELGVSIVPGLLMPADRLAEFEEFHACELYGGYGIFAGIDQDIRFEAIRRLLCTLSVGEISVVYGAVDLSRLQAELYASADPLDIAFRICVKGIEKWEEKRLEDKLMAHRATLGEDIGSEKLRTEWTQQIMLHKLEQLAILILDECDKKVKDTLQRTFRSLRPRLRRHPSEKISYFHDDMYFGDSRYSVGIQIADLCSYFIARHLDNDEEIKPFYEMIEPHIAFSEIYPPVIESPPEMAG